MQVDLPTADSLILMGNRLVISASRQTKVLRSIHEGNLGIEKCKARAKICVYWPNINQSIEELVEECSVCSKYTVKHIRKNHCNSIQYCYDHGIKLVLTILQ